MADDDELLAKLEAQNFLLEQWLQVCTGQADQSLSFTVGGYSNHICDMLTIVLAKDRSHRVGIAHVIGG